MLTKIIRKAGLGGTALKLLHPFAGKSCPLPDLEQAREILSGLNPDAGSSCIWDKTPRTSSGVELDIIIPAYNAEAYIARCLDSALNQKTDYSFRLIVIDDGSKDSTGKIIDSYASDPRLLIKHQENRGFSGARNAGLQLSDAEYISFLDSDDTLPDGAIEALMSCAAENNAAIVEGAFNSVAPDGRILSRTSHPAGRLKPRKELFGFTCMKLIHRKLISGICFPEGYWYEDSIMAQIIYPMCEKLGRDAYGVTETVYNYTVNPSGISHTGRRSPKSIDSLWITLALYKDRQKLGLEKDQAYYEYILNMLTLSYRRAEAQSEEAKKAMFVIWADFIGKEFPGFVCQNRRFEILEQAVRDGNYKLYRAACELI